uniref:Leucine-rich repeat-containing N-terminal plant-type domain-containing protein n=1 Tax=Corethron hystrix TaxID=216773 RepID=A0A7S1BDT3_9STRA|mmetsp:Transcript_21717/g.49374  ORF Transcript_21717/g.49374 Transcript_21717/m.49374 type:complete len:592 (+) Transcript_21717:308-2083(+)
MPTPSSSALPPYPKKERGRSPGGPPPSSHAIGRRRTRPPPSSSVLEGSGLYGYDRDSEYDTEARYEDYSIARPTIRAIATNNNRVGRRSPSPIQEKEIFGVVSPPSKQRTTTSDDLHGSTRGDDDVNKTEKNGISRSDSGLSSGYEILDRKSSEKSIVQTQEAMSSSMILEDLIVSSPKKEQSPIADESMSTAAIEESFEIDQDEEKGTTRILDHSFGMGMNQNSPTSFSTTDTEKDKKQEEAAETATSYEQHPKVFSSIEHKFDRHRRCMFIFLALVAISLVLGLGLGLGLPRSDADSDIVDLSEDDADSLRRHVITVLNESTVSKKKDLSSYSTYQGMSVSWILNQLRGNDGAVESVSRADLIQRYALGTLYYSTTQEWQRPATVAINSSNGTAPVVDDDAYVEYPPTDTAAGVWMTYDHECTWRGVYCNNWDSAEVENTGNRWGFIGQGSGDQKKRLVVKDLTLYNMNLIGKIPPEICHLSKLTSLSLEKNKLFGTIPHTISKLTNLYWLNLSMNKLTGPIPDQFSSLIRLTYLSLDNNQLEGKLPSNWGQKYKNLRTALLHNNKFVGNVPWQWGTISTLSEYTLLYA